ncbi:MAG: hypothetical protein K6G75_05790 [Lachnospiraceae bacterium]|nr:hypothetical protein [Lachnospiraceae bacterium]
MKITLTKSGKALVAKMKSENFTSQFKLSKPNLKMCTLIRLSDSGKVLSKEKVLADVSTLTKAA